MLLTVPSLLALLSAPLSQVVGGNNEQLHHWIGSASVSAFGYAVAPAGDVNSDGYNDVLIGEPFYDAGAVTDKGAFRVASGLDGSLLFRMTGSANILKLGASLANAGDVNGDGIADFIVGAPTSTAGGTERGAVLLFSGSDFSLIRSHEGLNDFEQFGHAVSTIGDLNRDGYADYAVGSPLASNTFGTVHLYSGIDGALLQKLTGGITHQLGYSVAAAGDVNADGFPDILVGSPNANNRFGIAAVYSGRSGLVIREFHGDPAGIRPQMGYSVSPAGDLNLDGYDDVLIGAARYGVSEDGAAYAYSGIDGSLMFEWHGTTRAWFGSAVTALDDLNGDSIPDIIVGAPRCDVGTMTWAGKAYAYSGLDGSQVLELSGQTDSGHFGWSLADAGDIDGDFVGDPIIGAPGPLDGSGRGAVFIHSFHPFLRINQPGVSVNNGGLLEFTVAFPPNAAGMPYKILLSKTGTGPSWYGVQIPLNRDAWTNDSYLGIYPVNSHNNMHGNLNPYARAYASMTLPPNLPWSAVGKTFYFAAIVEPVGGPAQWSSVAVPLMVVP